MKCPQFLESNTVRLTPVQADSSRKRGLRQLFCDMGGRHGFFFPGRHQQQYKAAMGLNYAFQDTMPAAPDQMTSADPPLPPQQSCPLQAWTDKRWSLPPGRQASGDREAASRRAGLLAQRPYRSAIRPPSPRGGPRSAQYRCQGRTRERERG